MTKASVFFIAIICLASFSGVISAIDSCPTNSALETFLCNANEEYHSLQFIGEVAILTGTSVPGTEGAVEEARQHLKPFLTKAKNTVFFNSKAGESLNDFYIYWVTLVDDFRPRPYEDLAVYRQRSDERYTALQEKANRLRIAAE
ncbi:exported hypothetical protein [Gammaproteobacteria bacterium]